MTRTARERVHAEMTAEILATARHHLARDGAAGLSLRSVARDLELAPSALYRYFPGRDALLSALILGAYDALADATEAAVAGNDPPLDRWVAAGRAVRSWALGHPHEWGLLFGTPVSGYEAPEDTLVPYRRIVGALLAPVRDAATTGGLAAPDPPAGRATATGTDTGAPAPADGELAAAVAPVVEELGVDLAPRAVPLLFAWSTLIGTVSLEVFGHWRNTVLDPGVFLDAELHRLAAGLGLT